MNKKIIAPIVITIVSVIIQIVYAIMIYKELGNMLQSIDVIWLVILEGIIVFMIVMSIKVLKERLEEIKGEDEDDLSKYWLYKR